MSGVHHIYDVAAFRLPWSALCFSCLLTVPDLSVADLDPEVLHPGSGLHLWIGRQLFGLFQRAGLRDVRVIPHALCFPGAAGFAVYQRLNRATIDQAVPAGQVSASEVAAWWAALERAAEAETFFSAVLGFIAAGCKA